MKRPPRPLIPLMLVVLLLAGCDMLGVETVPQVNARKEAEGKAIGSACRHAVRSIEDCFKSNPKAPKASVFAGWKEMDVYMRENQVVGMPSAAEQAAPEAGNTDAPDAEGDGGHSAAKGHSS